MSFPEYLLSQGTVERLGWMLVHFLWQGAVVAVLLAAVLRLLPRVGANLRYIIACSALVMMVVLPAVTMQFIEVAGPAAEAGPPPLIASPDVTPSAPATVQTVDEIPALPDAIVPLETADLTTPIPLQERIASALEPALPYLVTGWLAGVLGLSTWHLGGWAQLQRLKRRMVRRVGANLQQRAATLGVRLGVRRAVTLLESALVEVPTVVGWLRPAILLPASALTGLSPEQLEAILAHELAHIRRYDYLVNMLQTVVEILGFYHPAVWWVSHRIRIERENCCDDLAVRLCGDSVRYARALTCLEEIRHSQAELAVAATGGSLIERIARLLGRPATDDRRLAWLPGLIALLLIAGIVIPAALVLAASEPPAALPPTAVVPDDPQTQPGATDAAEQGASSTEPNIIRVDFVVARVLTDLTVDRETMLMIDNVLGEQIQPGQPGKTTIGEIFNKRIVGQPTAPSLIDLLISRGFMKVVVSPTLEVIEGQRASIATGQIPDPNATGGQTTSGDGADRYNVELTLEETKVFPRADATMLAVKVVISEPPTAETGERQTEPNRTAPVPVIDAEPHFTAKNGLCNTGPLGVVTTTVDGESRAEAFYLITKPTVTSAGKTDKSPASEPNAPRVDLRTEAAGEPNDAMAKRTQVLVKTRIIEVVDNLQLDRETVLQIEKILGKPVRPQGRAGEFGRRFRLTIGEVLREHVVQQSLPNETVQALIDLLASKGYMKVLAEPQVVAQDGKQSQLKAVSNEYFWTGSSTDGSRRSTELQKVEVGTILDVTPHVQDANNIRLNIKVELSDIAPGPRKAAPPAIATRSVAATVVAQSGRYVTLAGMWEGDTSSKAKDTKSVYIVMMPSLITPPDRWTRARTNYVNSDPVCQELAKQIVKVEQELIADAQKFAPDHPQMIRNRALLDGLNSRLAERKKVLEKEFEDQRAGHRALASDQTQARVDFFVADVSSERSLDRRTATEAAKLLAGTTLKPTARDLQRPLRQVLQEYAANAALSGPPLEAFMNLLIAGGYARRLAGPTLVMPDGRIRHTEVTTRIESLDSMDLLSVYLDAMRESREGGMTLLDLGIEVRRQMLEETPTDAAKHTIETAETKLMLRNGEFVAVPGSPPITWRDTRGAERTLFVMVKTDTVESQTAPAADDTRSASRPITANFRGEELRQVLEDISAMAGVPIVPDQDVTGPVWATMQDVSVDKALEIVLAGKPYAVKRMPKYYLVATREHLAGSKAGDNKEEQMAPMDRSDSRAWTIMWQWNCPPLLLGLTQQFAKVLQPSRQDDPAWRQVQDGGTLRLRLDVEGGLPGEVIVGLFKDARWLDEPVAVRRLGGAGLRILTGLPPGRYQIGAMLGNAPVPLALGVHRAWPEPVEIRQGQTATADVLVSEAFQKHATGWYNEEVAKDHLGQWGDLNETNLLQGQLTGPDGKPVRFGHIQIRQHNPGARSIAAPDRGTDEQGIYKCDEIAWPYRVNAMWREAIPSAFGYRGQWIYLSRVLEGPQRQDFRFEPFPEGTAKVAGRLVDQNGKPVKGFFLRLHMPPFNDLDLSNLTGGYKTQVTYDVPFISDDGRFELGGLPAGRATVDIVPFEIQRYQHERGKDVVLEEGKTANADFEIVGKGVFYGRVLFEDGTGAVIAPAPWRGAATRIFMTAGGRGLGVGEVGPDGYFTVYLGESDMEALALGDSRLVINVPTDQERRWDTAGEFPYEKLSEDKSRAGVVTVKRPLPTPTLPPELRQGRPLPQGWRLEYQERGGPGWQRITSVSVQVKPAASDSQVNRTAGDEQFELYGPDGKRVQEFRVRSMFILDKAQQYILIGRPDGARAPDDWRIMHGPYILDLSRPGQYTLTVDPATASEPSPKSPQDDADQNASRAWTVMRQINSPPLLLGLTQQLLKTLQPARQNDAMWREVAGGGSLRLDVKIEQEDASREIIVGLFKDAKWLEEPVAVRLLPGEGTHTLTGLPPGRYQIGAMIGPVCRKAACLSLARIFHRVSAFLYRQMA